MLIDGKNLLVRARYAAARHEMSNHEGIPTGPLVIFVNQLSRFIRDHRPDYVLVAWDGGRSAYRLNIDPDYKLARRGNGQDSDSHGDLAWTLLELCNIQQVILEGVEADDIIAHYWRHRDPTEDMVIVSGDKDFHQLLDRGVIQVAPGAEASSMDAEGVQRAYGCRPRDLPLVMALTGDAVDGVPGAPGFGTKTAVKVLDAADWSLV